MERVITYDNFTVNKDSKNRYYFTDEDGAVEVRVIHSLSADDFTEDELLNVDFPYDVSGEVDNSPIYMYFEYVS